MTIENVLDAVFVGCIVHEFCHCNIIWNISIWNASMLQREEILEAIKANGEKRPGVFVDLPATRKP